MTIGDMRVDLEIEMDERFRDWQDKYAAFLDDTGEARGIIRFVRSGQNEFRPLKPGPYEIHTSRDGDHLDFESYFEKGDFDFQTRRGTLMLTARGDPENYLRVLFAQLALDEGGLLVHSCGIIRNGRGYCFFGPSTYGKTTIAKLSADDTILSDDLTLIKKHNGRYFIFGVPFRGDLPEAPRTNAAVPLTGLVSLKKSESHRVEPLPSPRALAEIVSVVPFVMQDEMGRARVIDRVSDLVANVPAYTLQFRRDPGFWQLLERND